MPSNPRLLLDENLSWRVARGLSHAGYAVTTAQEQGLTSLRDNAVFQLAQQRHFVIVTRDSDFQRMFAPPHDGVIVVHCPTRANNTHILQCLLAQLPPLLNENLSDRVHDIYCS